ncbi:hypothetical protein GK091_24125 [Spirosoma agri]|uniref:Ig-like domain-containing protein n=1 Tax=Spirosoma agri TaxID=1987381 RepID=A0A6M0INS7_9BACT|nr:FG-GAP-like repeat-containing protein [Spirosoma agri]NEU69990.1 hypothetical protein [Spirosoma agri]
MIYFLSKTKITFLAGLLTLFWVMLATTVLGQGFIERTGDFGLNPFFNYNFYPNPPGASPSLADLDGDGDLELVVVNFEGSVSYNINTGGSPGDESFIYYRSPSPFTSLPDSYSPVSSSPISSLAGVVPSDVYNPSFDSSVNLKFSFGDLDGDGDLDGISGNEEGKILIFINSGSRNNPLFPPPGSAPIGPGDPPRGNSVVTLADPAAGINYAGEGVSFVNLADFDGDRDLDLLVLTSKAFHYLRNTGTTTNAVFEEVTGSGNPFNGFTPDAGHGNPVVGDIDGDGDLDVAVSGTSIAFYRNVGTTTAPVYVRINNAANPFNGITFSADDVPRIELGDMDRDNDLDLAGGVKSGKIRYFENGVQVYGQPTPASQTVCVGSPVSVTVGARGDGFYSDATQTTSLRYQWYRNTQTTATPVPGQTSATLSLTNVQPGDAGLYYVQVTGSARYTGEELSVFSDGFSLTVRQGIGITQQPPSSSVVLTGANVSVPVSVSGAVTGYQWYRNGAIVTGQTSATLTLTSVTSAQAGSYSLVATSSCNSVTSSAFSLTVLNPASVSGTKTVSGSFVPGGTATYTIVLRNAGLGIQNNNPGNEFTDVLPAGLTVSSVSSSAGQIAFNANTVTWNGSIASNSQVTITITALIANGTNGQSIANQGSISFDGDANNTNESTVLTDDPTVEGSANPTTFVVNCPASTVTLSNDGPLTCAKTSVVLTATGGLTGSTYGFSLGATQSSGATSNTATVSMGGLYSVTVTAPTGCTATGQTTVGTSTTLAAPTLAANAQTTTNQPISVTASGCAGGTINWNPQGGTGTANGSMYTFTQPGNYTITAACVVNACTSPPSAPLSVSILPGGFAIGSVTMVNCQLFDEAKGGYQVTFTPQYSGQNTNPISFSVVNEKTATTDPAPYTLRLYTDNPVIILVATQAGTGETRYSYNWFASCQSGNSPNRPPVTTGVPNQTISQGQAYQLELKTYFSDPDQQPLAFSVQGLPAGLSLTGSVISGTPSVTGVSTINVSAVDPGGLSVGSSFQLTVSPAPGLPTSFAIVDVSTVRCEVLRPDKRRITFTPQYSGVDGTPISFSVVNEKLPTTDAGPYSLDLYTDNPVITLSAQQGATIARYTYNWLTVCNTVSARLGVQEAGTELQVRVFGNPVEGKSAEIEINGAASQSVQLNLVDSQGRVVHQYQIDEAGPSERVSVPVGNSKGILLLQVSTPTQRQQVKLLKF